ncbi:MAG: leucine-rich repeat domain-containing protein [Bacteroidales bacterium]|nr:leucine-rich repeat domain-containing protein [Bacteroidales bacterium]
MKSKHFFKLSVLFTALLAWQFAQGQTFPVVTPSNHTVYFQIENNEAEATYCSYSMPNYGSSLSGTLIIPDSVEYNSVSYPVTSIGYNAFHHAYGIDTVILPNTITTIKQEAFSACADLASVIIPNSVTTLGNLAFAACHNLSDLTIGESVVTIGNQAFDADTSLVYVNIPNSVVSIGQAAFSQNYSLRTVRFGSSLTSIGFACFTNCPSLDSLIFVTEVAPYYSGEFWGSPDTLNIIIPCGSYHSYSNWFGTQHHYTVPTVELTMSVSSLQPQWGSATILKDADSNSVRCDSSVVVKAIPNYGYHFQQWSNGSTNVQDTLFINCDSSISALFAKNQYSLIVQSFDPSLGSVNGNGVYDYLDTVTVTATATAPHYFFEHWSDGSTESSRSVVITGDRLLTAYFAIDTHTVIVMADSIAHGSVSGGGRYTYGTVATLTAAPYSGYQFSHWSNGATYNPYIFAVLNDTVLTAYFIADWEPYQDTIYVYDTVYLPVHDTTYITLVDTITNTVFDTIINTVYDTTIVYSTDTLWMTLLDTVYLPQYIHDTIYVHDTIVVGVDEVDAISAKIYSSNGRIVVDGAQGNPVWLFDVNGRVLATKQDEYSLLRFDVPASGVYMVKIGNHSARKVVVIR